MIQPPPILRSPVPPPPTPSGSIVPAPRLTPNPNLPTMADLDRLQTQLDAVDHTLAELDQTTA